MMESNYRTGADIRWEETAKGLIREIAFDSGMVSRQEELEYPADDVARIAVSARAFFGANPELETPESINEICCGEYSENEAKYGCLAGWSELQRDLNTYFNGEDDG